VALGGQILLNYFRVREEKEAIVGLNSPHFSQRARHTESEKKRTLMNGAGKNHREQLGTESKETGPKAIRNGRNYSGHGSVKKLE